MTTKDTVNHRPLESVEQALLHRLVENQVIISRNDLASAASVGRRTVNYVNARLVATGRWNIVPGGGLAATTYTYLGK